jgi:dihydrolipoamide dehydrogenase
VEHEFDVIVVGAGPAGEVIAGRLADRGSRKVAIVERHLVGGECSFYACMPSKALLRPAEALREVRRIPGAAEAATGELDPGAVLARRDEVIHNLSDESQLPWLESREIALFRGDGRLDGERRVRVGDDVLNAREAVVIATGSAAVMPPIPGLADVGAWSNRELTTSEVVPESLLVLGGGVVGVEMAQAWSSLGTRVTVIEAFDTLIAREEPIAGETVRAELEGLGVAVHTGSRASEVRRDGEEVVVTLEDGTTHRAARILVCIGRRPLTEDLGLESVGLTGGGYLEVDEHLRVGGRSWLYAIGDANGRALLTHAGKYQGRIAADCILGEPAAALTDGKLTPRVIFTDPEVAAVGYTLADARAAGMNVDAIDIPTSSSAGASFFGRDAPGDTRFVVDLDREVLVGVTFVGAEVSDFLHAATIAIVGAVPLSQIAHAIAPFPTRNELWLYFVEAFERRSGKSLHVRTDAG